MNRTWWTGAMIVIGVVVAAGCASSGGSDPDPAPLPSDEVQQSAAEEPVDEPLANTLKWTTASEVDNFGFDIYRSLSEDGPFDRITSEPLAGAGTTDEPQKYVFVDDDIDPSMDYFYYIESISLGGVREVFSPIIRAPAKRPPEVDD